MQERARARVREESDTAAGSRAATCLPCRFCTRPATPKRALRASSRVTRGKSSSSASRFSARGGSNLKATTDTRARARRGCELEGVGGKVSNELTDGLVVSCICYWRFEGGRCVELHTARRL